MDLEEDFATTQDERNLELQMFRERWKQELGAKTAVPAGPTTGGYHEETSHDPNVTDCSRSTFEIAAEIFREGMKEERNGRVYEAISLYRHAMQLDPDIEFKMEKSAAVKPKNRVADVAPRQVPTLSPQEMDDEQETEEDILERLLTYDTLVYGTCLPEYPLGDTDTHISALPLEVLQYITQWLVSSELDMLSLERFTIVCRGFYRTGRDDAVWRLACMRIWGKLCERPEALNYGSWRQMFIQRPQIRFNGVYISRISYIRPGEASFIDQNSNYRPWHTVYYYRFFRFFADGTVLYANTPGCFRLTPDGEGVTIYLKRDLYKDDMGQRQTRNKRNSKKEGTETLVMELAIRSSRGRLHGRLDWKRYSITRKIGKIETHSLVDVHQQFPSSFFSRVKSYTGSSENPLE
ncbi:F-box only protein 9-like isoform X2 [Paramacrobiotus metropolitanus]|uniref:F-box only protein 9-like isoform X2 n=1 Tax=Paramacrobiotus metropolitanus TaxID=2943436 RepID=UPI002445C4D4|nr:F-box only protein 9-like isoform X2 [Paramacrobiotus metropolitanus]